MEIYFRGNVSDKTIVVKFNEIEDTPLFLDKSKVFNFSNWGSAKQLLELKKFKAKLEELFKSFALPWALTEEDTEVIIKPFYRRVERENIVYDENVQFTAYSPKELDSVKWQSLLVFVHLGSARSPGETDPIEEVKSQAKQILGSEFSFYNPTAADSSQAIPKKGLITLSPQVLGIEFNPKLRSFKWDESVHREEFRIRGFPRFVGQTARGKINVFLGVILIAEVSISIKIVDQVLNNNGQPKVSSARPYRKIFPSYSHKDGKIVEQFMKHANSIGDRYLKDTMELRSGERWEERLKEYIIQAEVFQLFWSNNSIESKYVENEWQYALSLNRANFIRPVYWEVPFPMRENPPSPNTELRKLHFHFFGDESLISGELGFKDTDTELPPGANDETGGENNSPEDNFVVADDMSSSTKEVISDVAGQAASAGGSMIRKLSPIVVLVVVVLFSVKQCI